MDRFEIGTLRAYYGNLLTQKQNETLRLKCDEDLSYGEIAEMFNVSRQAVLENIKKGESALFEFEEKLKLIARESAVKKCITEALSMLSDSGIEDVKTLLDKAIGFLEE